LDIRIRNPKRDPRGAEIKKALHLAGLTPSDLAAFAGRNVGSILRLINASCVSDAAPPVAKANRDRAMKHLVVSALELLSERGVDYIIDD